MSMMEKLRGDHKYVELKIINDGLSTKVIDVNTGAEVIGVTNVQISLNVHRLCVVHLEVVGCEVDVRSKDVTIEEV